MSLFVGLGVWMLGSATSAQALSLNQLPDATATLDQVVGTVTDDMKPLTSSSKGKGADISGGRTAPSQLSSRKTDVMAGSANPAAPVSVNQGVAVTPLELLAPLPAPQLGGVATTARQVSTVPFVATKQPTGIVALQASESGWRLFGVPWYGWLAGGIAARVGSQRARLVLSRRSQRALAME